MNTVNYEEVVTYLLFKAQSDDILLPCLEVLGRVDLVFLVFEFAEHLVPVDEVGAQYFINIIFSYTTFKKEIL